MTTLNLQVSATNRDAYEQNDGTINLYYEFLLNYSNRYGAMAWQADIPQGATITSATLQMYISGTTRDDPQVDIYGIDADNVSAFTTTSYSISSLTKTTATTYWSGTSLGAGYKSIDVTDIVQEIVDRAGWAANNYLGILAVSRVTSNVFIMNYDHSQPPKLGIEYTAAAAGATKAHKLRRGSRLGAQIGT